MARKPETNLQNNILIHASKLPGLTLFRNVVGEFRTQQGGGYVKTGLCPGSSDLIGYRTVVITPDMVGEKIAQFVAVEVKTPKKGSRESEKQFLFRQRVSERGGLAVVTRSVDNFLEAFGVKKI